MNVSDNLIERTLRALRNASAEADPRRSEMRALILEWEEVIKAPPAASHPEDAERLADIRHNYNMTEFRGADVGADVVFMLRLYDAARAENDKQ